MTLESKDVCENVFRANMYENIFRAPDKISPLMTAEDSQRAWKTRDRFIQRAHEMLEDLKREYRTEIESLRRHSAQVRELNSNGGDSCRR